MPVPRVVHSIVTFAGVGAATRSVHHWSSQREIQVEQSELLRKVGIGDAKDDANALDVSRAGKASAVLTDEDGSGLLFLLAEDSSLNRIHDSFAHLGGHASDRAPGV